MQPAQPSDAKPGLSRLIAPLFRRRAFGLESDVPAGVDVPSLDLSCWVVCTHCYYGDPATATLNVWHERRPAHRIDRVPAAPPGDIN
jgi:hypothetical protein